MAILLFEDFKSALRIGLVDAKKRSDWQLALNKLGSQTYLGLSGTAPLSLEPTPAAQTSIDIDAPIDGNITAQLVT